MSEQNPEPADEGPFAGSPEGMEAGPEPADEPDRNGESPDKAFNFYGLRNTEADVDPDAIREELDPEAGPAAHLTMGAAKQIGAGGVEAWMHYVLAAYLFIDPEGELLDTGSDPDAEAEDEPVDWGGADG